VFSLLQESVRLTLSRLFGRASGSAGGSAADPARGAPATEALAAKARRKPDKRRAAAGNAAGSNDYDNGAPSEGRPGKRHRAAAAGTPRGDDAGVARAALGAVEVEARLAGAAAYEDDDGGDARAALRHLGVRSADPRFAAALAHERADFAKQARSFWLCAVVSCSAAVSSVTITVRDSRMVSRKTDRQAPCTLPCMRAAWGMSW